MVQSFFSELKAFKIYGCSSVQQSMRLSTQGSVNQSQPHPAVQGPDPGSPLYRAWRCPRTCSNLFTRKSWTVPKYRSNSVYTSSYKRHRTVQYSRRADGRQSVSEQLVTRHSREHTLSAVGPDAPVE